MHTFLKSIINKFMLAVVKLDDSLVFEMGEKRITYHVSVCLCERNFIILGNASELQDAKGQAHIFTAL